MAYFITLSNGASQIIIPDEATDTTTTSLTLIGRNTIGIGQIINANEIHLLENWASSVAPSNPMIGQLWYNSQTQVLMVCTAIHPSANWIPTVSVMGLSGTITKSQLVTAGLAPLDSPALTGTPTAPTADGTTAGQIVNVQYAASTYAPIASPTLTGVPKAPTANGNTPTQIVNVQYATNNLAPLASPALSGTPTAPTANPGTATTQIASTAFVDDAVSTATATLLVGKNYSFNLASPPGSDIALSPGDRLTISFSNVSAIPFHVASVTGLYRLVMVITSTNTPDSNWVLFPNNTAYTNEFSVWNIENGSSNLSGLGGAGSLAAFTHSTLYPYVGDVPVANTGINFKSGFFFDSFAGPFSPDTINGVGPSLHEMLITTVTASKMIKQSSAIHGGPAANVSIWSDTTTAWTSLGTMSDEYATQFSGCVYIEMLAAI